MPDGVQLACIIDGHNRRIGKQVNGTLVQGLPGLVAADRPERASRLVGELNPLVGDGRAVGILQGHMRTLPAASLLYALNI